jgi:hypothetical protein
LFQSWRTAFLFNVSSCRTFTATSVPKHFPYKRSINAPDFGSGTNLIDASIIASAKNIIGVVCDLAFIYQRSYRTIAHVAWRDPVQTGNMERPQLLRRYFVIKCNTYQSLVRSFREKVLRNASTSDWLTARRSGPFLKAPRLQTKKC